MNVERARFAGSKRERGLAFVLTLALMIAVACIAMLSTPVSAEPARAARTIVVVAQNSGTEVTDFLVPYGVMKRANVGDVRAVATGEGPISFWPGLKVEPDDTLASFDAAHPDGADMVIIPAVLDPEDAVLIDWLKIQAAKGARLVSICDGALVLARTGLLDGRKATGHWYTEGERRASFSAVDWQTNTRYVRDGNVATSAGVSASLPISLQLVEEMAGKARAEALAAELAVGTYSPDHNSDVYGIGVDELLVVARNFLLGWPRETYAIHLSPGMDEVALGFAVDMSARTYRSSSVTIADAPVRTRGGLVVLPDLAMADLSTASAETHIVFSEAGRGALVGEETLVLAEGEASARQILSHFDARYGKASADFVALQLEYPR